MPLNIPAPPRPKVDGRDTLVSIGQLAKAVSPASVTPSGITTVLRRRTLAHMPALILVTLLPRITLCRAVQPAKAFAPTDVTEGGRTISDKAIPDSEPAPNVVSPFINAKFSNFTVPRNAFSPITFTERGR